MESKLEKYNRLKEISLTELVIYWKEQEKYKSSRYYSCDSKECFKKNIYEPGIEKLESKHLYPNIGRFKTAMIYHIGTNHLLKKYNQYGNESGVIFKANRANKYDKTLTKLILYWKEPQIAKNGKPYEKVRFCSNDTFQNFKNNNYIPGILSLEKTFITPNIGRFRMALMFDLQNKVLIRKYDMHGNLIERTI